MSKYDEAIENIQTVADLKKAFTEMLVKFSDSHKGRQLGISAKDHDDCVIGIAEQIDEMAWVAIREAKQIIEITERAERREHQRLESTYAF
jgi:hypothetical protein